jgi:hypothetical protein
MKKFARCPVGYVALLFASTLGIAIAPHSSAATLQISRTPSNAIVTWPNSAAGSTLQFADQLPPATGWLAFPRARSTNGASLRVNDASQVPARFFRLFDGGPPQPPHLTVNGPSTLRVGETNAVTLQYADPNGDIALLTVTRTNSHGGGSSPIPAALLGLGGTNGQITLPMDAGKLPFGPTQLGFQLTDMMGLNSAFQTLTLQVNGVAAGGTPPSIVFDTATNLPVIFDLPTGILDRFRPRLPVHYTDPDGDLYRVRVRIVTPVRTNEVEETAAALSMTGTSGVVSIPFLTFSNTSPLGEYTVEITGSDRNGNLGATASRTIQAVTFGGQAGPPRFSFFSGFSPTNGGAGTEVTISGISFDPDPANNRVFLNDVPLEVLDSSFSMLRVRITEAAESGPFIIHTASGGAAVTPRSFRVPPSVKVSPENPPTDEAGALAPQAHVAAATAIQLRAKVVPTTAGGDRSVNWSVNGLPGGNAAVGTITTNGLFTAPGHVPTSPVVRVVAALRSAPAVTGALDLIIVSKPPLPGAPALIRALEGGTVFARDLRASIQVPPGALNADTSLIVRDPDMVPVAQPGRRVLGYAEFLPSGTVFNAPVQVTLPLKRVLSPGTVLPLRSYLPVTGAYTDEGFTAIVTEAGDRATASVSHFTIMVVDEPEAAAAAASAASPVIASIDPNVVLEGERVPVRLLGAALAADAVVEIRNADGTPASVIAVETYLGRGTNAGVLLKIGNIAGFNAGTREFRLRVTRPGGAGEASFQVRGLPELEVGAGQTLNFDQAPPLMVSGIHVEAGGRVVVQSGRLEVESTGDVLIDGVIDAAGGRGGDGHDREPGQPGPRGHGGWGGWGRVDSDGFFGLDGAEPENYGKNANDAIGYSEPEQGFSRPFGPGEREPQGIGGPPGGNLDVNPSQIAAQILECVTTFGVACLHSADELARLGRQLVNVIDGNAPGKRGYGAVKNSALEETGGGGGGGAGMISVSVSLDILELLFGFDLPSFLDAVSISLAVPGGGGGGGGDGGRDVHIRAPGTILLGDTAQITTAGGDGGNGSSTSTWDISVTPLYVPPIPGLPALSGGAGGGGRAGNVSLVSGLGIQYRSFDQIVTHGGRGGEGGVAYLDPQNRVSRYQLIGNAAADGPNGKRLADQPVLDPTQFRPKVTSRLLLPIDARAGWPFPPDASGAIRPITIVVQGEGPNQRATFPIRPGGSVLQHAGFALLFPGHNTVSTQPAHLAFPQRVLALAADADGDGLSDDDEADLRSNPDVADTDGDGLNDGADVVAGGSPLRADTDGDGLRDGEEVALGTMPHRADSDGDSFWDSAELVLGSNPLSKTNAPTEITAGLLFSSAIHSNTPGGAHLAGIERANGRFGLLGRPANGFGFGLAFDHFGALYIADGPRLRIYDPLAQTATDVGEFDSTNQTIQCAALAFNFVPTNRALFGVKLGGPPNFENTGQLLRIDRRTGAAMIVGAPLPQPIRALAFSDTGKLFAALQDAGGADLLVELDPATGAISRILASNGVAPLAGLAFARDGALLASRPIGAAESQLMLIDQTNGNATLVQNVARQLYGLAEAPCPVPCLGPAVATNTAPVPERLVAVDFSGDGLDDLIQLGWNGPTSFGTTATFYRSEGDGRFTLVTNHVLNGNLTSPARELAVADLNGDGGPDLVVVLPAQGFSVVLNDGAGSYLAPLRVNLPASKALALGDLNGDGTNDMAFVADGDILLFPGDGTGGFLTPTSPIPPDPERYILDVKLADLNGDTWPDLVLMDSAKIVVALNNGNGTFAGPTVTTVAFEDNGFAVADFDQDGVQDISIALAGNPRGFELHRGLGNGRFDPPGRHLLTNIVASAFLEDFAVADFDGDGFPDFAFTEPDAGKLSLWMNDDPFGFRVPRRSPLKGLASPGPVAVGDFNGDGKPDVASGDNSANRRAVWLSQ